MSSFITVAFSPDRAYRAATVAAKRTPEQQAEVGAFVNRLYEVSGAPSWTEFARRAGVWSPNLSKWQTGTSIPDGWNLYRLMKEATRARAERETFVTVDELVEVALAVGPQSTPDELDLLARLTATVAASNATNEAILARLEQLERDRESRLRDGGDHQSAGGEKS